MKNARSSPLPDPETITSPPISNEPTRKRKTARSSASGPKKRSKRFSASVDTDYEDVDAVDTVDDGDAAFEVKKAKRREAYRKYRKTGGRGKLDLINRYINNQGLMKSGKTPQKYKGSSASMGLGDEIDAMLETIERQVDVYKKVNGIRNPKAKFKLISGMQKVDAGDHSKYSMALGSFYLNVIKEAKSDRVWEPEASAVETKAKAEKEALDANIRAALEDFE